jgi:hypothetical protein
MTSFVVDNLLGINSTGIIRICVLSSCVNCRFYSFTVMTAENVYLFVPNLIGEYIHKKAVLVYQLAKVHPAVARDV